MEDADWPDVRRIYAQGIATRNATFETRVPSRATLRRKWLAGQRWVAELDGDVVGWAAVTAVSSRECYAGVLEVSIYIGDGMRGRGIGKVLITQQVRAADDAGFWTLQTSIFPENEASIRLHEWAGFRVVGVRERIAQLDGQWRDTVLLERRSPTL
jgi:L-amino acid N-acyltransferase YncA